MATFVVTKSNVNLSFKIIILTAVLYFFIEVIDVLFRFDQFFGFPPQYAFFQEIFLSLIFILGAILLLRYYKQQKRLGEFLMQISDQEIRLIQQKDNVVTQEIVFSKVKIKKIKMVTGDMRAKTPEVKKIIHFYVDLIGQMKADKYEVRETDCVNLHQELISHDYLVALEIFGADLIPNFRNFRNFLPNVNYGKLFYAKAILFWVALFGFLFWLIFSLVVK